MKKILEYKVFDLLQNKDNEIFLDKVKKENPDLYSKFLNILGNKGLEIAKQKYQEFDPEYVKQKEKEEKQKNAKIKAIGRKKFNEEAEKTAIENILFFNEAKVKEIEKILSNSVLNEIYNYIMNDKRINNYLTSYRTKKQYVNHFSILLKKPSQLKIYRLKNFFEYNSIIDSLLISYEEMNWDADMSKQDMIKINQYYDSNKKELTYSIYFNIPDIFVRKVDINKNENFLRLRKEHIEKMNLSGLTTDAIYKIIDKFSAALDERIYQGWYEKWKENQTISKYNL